MAEISVDSLGKTDGHINRENDEEENNTRLRDWWIKWWAGAADGGVPFKQHWLNVSCELGLQMMMERRIEISSLCRFNAEQASRIVVQHCTGQGFISRVGLDPELYKKVLAWTY